MDYESPRASTRFSRPLEDLLGGRKYQRRQWPGDESRRNSNDFPAAMTALVTPFDREGKVHEEHLKRLIEFQIAGGVDCSCLRHNWGELDSDDVWNTSVYAEPLA